MFEKPKRSLIFLILAILLLFILLAKLDYVLTIHPKRSQIYDLKLIRVDNDTYWLWFVGYPTFALIFAFAYYAGSQNAWYSLGVFLTILILAGGQLEDFFFHIVNGLPFPSGAWSCDYGWSKDNNIYFRIFSTWTTPMHFALLLCSIITTILMWTYIFDVSQR